MKRLLFLLMLSGWMLTSCSVTTPIAATENPIGSKVGKSGGTCYLGLCMDVDASIVSAAKNGGITKISTVDYRTRSYFGIVKKYECIVTGE